MERSEHPCPDMGIDGVSFQPLKVITTPGGPVMHMLRPDSPLRPHAETADGELHLGEVYFSEVLPGAIKAWKRHRRQTQYYTVPHGLLKLVLYDAAPIRPPAACCGNCIWAAPTITAFCASPRGSGTASPPPRTNRP